MSSIRQRLAVGLISGLAALVILVGALVLPALHRLLVAEFDYALLAKARALTTLAEPARRGVNLQFTEASLPEFQPGAGAEYFQAALANGTVLARSPSLGDASFTPPSVVTSASLFWNVTLPGARYVHSRRGIAFSCFERVAGFFKFLSRECKKQIAGAATIAIQM